MAERTVVPGWMLAPIPDRLSDAEAAALINPGMAAYLPFAWRGRLAAGETALVLGATGVTGRLAVQMARLLGAGRVVAAGRDPEALASLTELGADALISLDRPRDELVAAFSAEAGDKGFHVVVDYLWGPPMEALLAALTRDEFKAAEHETRIVQVGDIAGPAIPLPADALRGARVTLTGSGGFAPPEVRREAFGKLCEFAGSGALKVAVEEVPLAEVERAWQRGRPRGQAPGAHPLAPRREEVASQALVTVTTAAHLLRRMEPGIAGISFAKAHPCRVLVLVAARGDRL